MLKQIVEPESDLFSLEEIKALIGVENSLTLFDEEIRLWMRAATSWVQEHTRHILRESTWKLTLPEFPRDKPSLEIPLYPVQSIASVQYYDSSGTLQTWAASNYVAAIDCDTPMLAPIPNKIWPLTACRPDAVQITMIAGYEIGTDDDYQTPELLKLGVQSLVREYWNRRGDGGAEEDVQEPSTVHVRALLEPIVRKARIEGSIAIRP